MLLILNRPVAVVGIEQRDVRDWGRAVKSFLRGGKVTANLADLFVDGKGSAIRAEERAVILLLSVERAAPLPVAHFIRAVCDRLPRHRADFAFVQKVIYSGPIHRAWLSFHHPKILMLESAGEVVSQTVVVGIEMSAAHVVVPGGEG